MNLGGAKRRQVTAGSCGGTRVHRTDKTRSFYYPTGILLCM